MQELYFLPEFALQGLGPDLRVHPSTRRSVVYVGLQTGDSFLPVGTGFVAATDYREHRFFFFVTADHVVDLISGDTVFIRMNTREGIAGPPIPISKTKKIEGIDRRHDLAIFPVPPIHNTYDADYVLLDRGEYKKILEEVWHPELGDEVATVGLYTSHHGHTKNIPVVRVGHIAMMPDEPVMSTRGYVEAYLVEVRSILGLSGSPVCITIPPLRVGVNNKIEILDTGLGAVCIGMMLGYHLSASKEDEIVVPTFQQPPQDKKPDEESNGLSLDERNTGFAVVLPIECLFDVMESDAMKEKMDRAIDKAKGRVRAAGAPVAQDVEKPDLLANELHPNGRERFNSLLDVAVKTPESKG